MGQDQPYHDRSRQANEDERRQLLDRLVAQFAEAAYHWARIVLEDEDKVYDAVQEAWLNAYLHLDQLRDGAAFPGWFRQIVLTACYRAIRREKPSIPLSEQLPEEAVHQPDPVEEIEQNERLARIREAVLALPEAERLVTELFYFDDYAQQEIAEALAVPLTTVKKRLQYARRRLKGMIHPDIVAKLDLFTLNSGDMGIPFGADDDLLAELSTILSNHMRSAAFYPPTAELERLQPDQEAVWALPAHLSRILK